MTESGPSAWAAKRYGTSDVTLVQRETGSWACRSATRADLTAINAVVERAVMSWDLPERVKRLSLPSYRYTEHDLQMLELMVAEDESGTVVGVAAWEEAEASDVPSGRTGMLLHGLYVDPEYQRQGVGFRLFAAAVDAARANGVDGLLVKAQADAEGFFLKLGLQKLPVQDSQRHYARRFWLALGS